MYGMHIREKGHHSPPPIGEYSSQRNLNIFMSGHYYMTSQENLIFLLSWPPDFSENDQV